MAVLRAKQVNRLPARKFGLPGKTDETGKAKGKYPMPDRAHAGNAKARASQQLAKGNLTPAEAAKIRHKADVVLGQHDSTYHSIPGK